MCRCSRSRGPTRRCCAARSGRAGWLARARSAPVAVPLNPMRQTPRLDANAGLIARISAAADAFAKIVPPVLREDAAVSPIAEALPAWRAACAAHAAGAHADATHCAQLGAAKRRLQTALRPAIADAAGCTCLPRERALSTVCRANAPQGARWPLQYSLLDVSAMLVNNAHARIALCGLDRSNDAHLCSWWPHHVDQVQADNQRLYIEMIGPVNSKINEFAMSDVARRIFGQPESTIDLGALLRDGGILLVDLAGGRESGVTSRR